MITTDDSIVIDSLVDTISCVGLGSRPGMALLYAPSSGLCHPLRFLQQLFHAES